LDLLNILAYSWYFSGTKERLIFSEMLVELAYIMERNWRENVVELVSCKAQSRADTLIIAM